jgi:hypothetical protein
MEKISINEVISSGEWLQHLEKDVNMKMRILSIRNVDLAEIDDINEVNNNLPLSSSKLLMLGTEIINVSRVTNYPPKLLLKDQDDFQFAELEDSHLKICSDFAHTHHLYVPDLIPKLKYKVEYLFLVPVEDTQYFLGAVSGIIKRI